MTKPCERKLVSTDRCIKRCSEQRINSNSKSSYCITSVNTRYCISERTCSSELMTKPCERKLVSTDRCIKSSSEQWINCNSKRSDRITGVHTWYCIND